MDITLLYWALPIILILLLIFRNSSRSKDSGNTNKGKGFKLKYLIYLFLLAGCGFALVKLIPTMTKPSCPTKIPPEAFAEIIGKDFNFLSGVMYEADFEYEKFRNRYYFGEKMHRYIESDYTKLSNDDLKEYVSCDYEPSSGIRYVIKSKKKYEKYFEYLKSIGAERFNPENFLNYNEVVSEVYPSFKYKSCVFAKCDYLNGKSGYTIYIYPYSHLKNKKTALSCIDSVLRSDVKFKQINSNKGFLNFYQGEEATIGFDGKLDGVYNVKGHIRIEGVQVIIYSGDCEGTLIMNDNCTELNGNLFLKSLYADINRKRIVFKGNR